MTDTAIITPVRVIPVGGRDSMLLHLCGAHATFTRELPNPGWPFGRKRPCRVR